MIWFRSHVNECRYFGSSTVLDSPASGATSPAESLSPPLSRSTSPGGGGGGTLQRLQSWEEEGQRRCAHKKTQKTQKTCWRLVCCCVKLGSIPVVPMGLLLCAWLAVAREEGQRPSTHTVVSLTFQSCAVPCCLALPCAVRMSCCCVVCRGAWGGGMSTSMDGGGQPPPPSSSGGRDRKNSSKRKGSVAAWQTGAPSAVAYPPCLSSC
eukprot:COSAG06_NODE_1087_length_10749_cov_1130.191174_10_plen_208_part_00